ncbi:MAG: DNA-binding response regulator, OmpR family, contains REC and winged-helix (wHTH) domain [Chloroflexi bacterium AL-W]|nr:DNA-binding response regulator, OmpR family, contains REC and winged-helix (wHTH) domain [Chloroflexi bacterium AL-W]
MTHLSDSGKRAIQIVAHELKTPLTTTSGFLNLVQNVGELNELQAVYLERAMGSLERMHNIIESIQDWVRILDGANINASAEVDLSAIIAHSVDFVHGIAQPQNITLHAEVAEDARQVKGDENLLTHVIINLMSNAIKYNRPEGKVWIRTHKTNNEVIVEVEDTGVGIDPKYHSKVFEQFFRATRKDAAGQRIEGTGLGLAICKKIVELHQGRMWLSSTLGEGSTFYFALPT